MTGHPKPFGLPDEGCADLAKPDYVNFAFSIFILLGILVSYLPQHVRIINRRSSFGLSPYFVLLGTTSGTCQFANILTLPGSMHALGCCIVVDGFACFAGMLGVMQVGMQWTCFAVILLLFLIFFPRATPPTTDPAKDADNPPSYKTAVTVVIICIVHAFITIILSIYFAFGRPGLSQSWANFLGIFSTCLAVIQYMPQIYTTYMLKRVASLSIPMMCIQTPGAFVWAASLAARVGPAGWSTWVVFVVTGTLQGTLLCMGVYYEIKARRKERDELQGRIDEAQQTGQDEADEQTPLIRDDR